MCHWFSAEALKGVKVIAHKLLENLGKATLNCVQRMLGKLAIKTLTGSNFASINIGFKKKLKVTQFVNLVYSTCFSNIAIPKQ